MKLKELYSVNILIALATVLPWRVQAGQNDGTPAKPAAPAPVVHGTEVLNTTPDATPDTKIKALTRAEAIRQTLADIDGELKDHGGTFEKWGEAIKPFRTALSGPKVAKNNFAFEGRDLQLVQRDTFDNEPEGKRPFELILEVHKRLKAQGVDLIFVPLPDKLAIYPDYLSDAAPADHKVYPAVKQLMKKLLENDVECIDLYPAFHAARRQNEGRPLYYDRDAHWRNAGAQLAGEQIAQRLTRYDFVQKALATGNRYSVKPEKRTHNRPDDLLVVLDSRTNERYVDSPDSPILITGDSNLMMNMGPVAAHMPAQVARHIGMPLAFGPNSIPSQHYENLAGKKVVVWCNIARLLVGLSFPTK